MYPYYSMLVVFLRLYCYYSAYFVIDICCQGLLLHRECLLILLCMQLSKYLQRQPLISQLINNILYILIKQIEIQSIHQMSKSSSIKSKAEKKREKRQQKQSQMRHQLTPKNHIEIVVDSQSDNKDLVELIPEPKKQRMFDKVEKRNEYSNTSRIQNRGENNFNNFNFQRIKKMQSTQRTPPKGAILGVQQVFQGLQQTVNQSSKPISYKRAGVAASKTTSEHYLKSRLQKIEQENKPPSNLLIEIDPQPKQSNGNQQQNEKEEPVKLKRIPRYFDEEVNQQSSQNEQQNNDEEADNKKSIKCYRCGERGHIARMCNQQQVLKCTYCLGPHHTSDCSDKLCHRCNQKGHIKQQCQSDKIQCRKCRAYGHISKNCGKIVMMNFRSENQKEIRDKYARDDIEKLKCLKCNGVHDSKGHFNCHQYSRKIPKIYSESYVVL